MSHPASRRRRSESPTTSALSGARTPNSPSSPRAQPSNGSCWLVLFNDSDQANALGCHDLTTGGLSIGKVFAASELKAGTSWTVTARHELLEMLGDHQHHFHRRRAG